MIGASTQRRTQWRTACLIGLTTVAMSGCGGSSRSSTVGSGSSVGKSATTPIHGATGPAGGATGSTGVKTGLTVPTRSQFIVEADRICGNASRQLNPQQARLDATLKTEQSQDTPAHRAALGAALREETGLVRPQLDRLSALTPPPGDRAAIARYIATVAAEADLTDQFATAVEANDGPGVTRLATKLTQGKATATRLAKGYGFKICGTSKA
jgi:hypothetical protein